MHVPSIANIPDTRLALLNQHVCRGAALPSIAQWISGLFGSVDLAPSDITAALVLAAAAQRRRRKNRIKKALNPILKAASNAATSATSDEPSDIDTESTDDSEFVDITIVQHLVSMVYAAQLVMQLGVGPNLLL